MLPIIARMRRLALTLVLVAGFALPGTASASQLIARDTRDVTIRVNANGQALLGYTAKGKRWDVLAWGAINAVHPSPDRRQVAFRLDYSGGWGTYRKTLSSSFRNVCGRYAGPELAWFVAG